MKNFIVFLCLISLNLIFVNSFSFEKRIDENKKFVIPDEKWPESCPIPECEKVDKSAKYPTPQARYFYQCTSDGKRWIPQLIPCPCNLLFSYIDQQCVYPWNLKQHCTSDYVVDILPTNC
ncbi:hypothetical protein PVAND_016032 [Polypedilum vanderplanki]|uniref:Chitin-binding type-2 domain-containing protein n=1 Tax=Polypedilum vanderplanki TaxID=319348 RepID=A0A9J6BEA1_POLVA|nr:hypothetical protein PVAND_016032 [Polypedilum vanderplanki]